MPARPEKVSGWAPHASPRRAISTSPRLCVVAQAEAVDAAGREGDHILGGGAQLDADEVLVHVHTEDERVDRVLQALGQIAVGAGDHGGGRKPVGDLLGHVRSRQDGDRPSLDARRQALARPRLEPLGQAEHGRRARENLGDVGERAARDGEHDQLGLFERCSLERHGMDAAQVHALEVPRVLARRGDRPGLLGVAADERHGVAAVAQQGREGRPPRPAADDEDVHDRRTKSTETGTP
jgi:hypothetical protein